MEVAEDLYNRGILSYPRTETDVVRSACRFESLCPSAASFGAVPGLLLLSVLLLLRLCCSSRRASICAASSVRNSIFLCKLALQLRF